MRIREANLQDCDAIARVQVDSYRTAYAGLLPQEYLANFTYEEQEQDWRDLVAAEQHDLIYVAETDTGEIMGYALGRKRHEGTKNTGELVALHVHRLHQRQSIGKQLMAAVAEHLGQQGCSSLKLWVLAQNPARAFYEHLGGTLAGERRWSIEEIGLDVIEAAYEWPDITSL